MTVRDEELVIVELDTDDALQLVAECDGEGVSFSEKLSGILSNFLERGDNHQGGGYESPV